MIKIYNSQTHEWQNVDGVKKYQSNSWKKLPVFIYHNSKWKPAYKRTGIYGMKWYFSGGSERTDESLNLPQIDPRPYNPSLTKAPYSPFDFAYPWSNIVRAGSQGYGAGELVYIPKYYYKWTVTNDYIQLQISDSAQTGFSTSPAHADRGMGREGDDVFVGRYLCAGSNGNSDTNSEIKIYKGINNFGHKASQSPVWGYDFAMHYTIAMLCLVEFGTWNPHTIIGAGNGDGGRTGATDSMPYHTGITTNDRMQYRYIEDLWCYEGQFTHGARRVAYDVDNNCPLYSTNNPVNYVRLQNSYSSWTSKIFNSTPTVSSVKFVDEFEFPSNSDFAYFPNPSSLASSGSTFGVPYKVFYRESTGGVTSSDEIYIMGEADDNDNINKSIYGMSGLKYESLTSNGAHRRWQVIPHAPRS